MRRVWTGIVIGLYRMWVRTRKIDTHMMLLSPSPCFAHKFTVGTHICIFAQVVASSYASTRESQKARDVGTNGSNLPVINREKSQTEKSGGEWTRQIPMAPKGMKNSSFVERPGSRALVLTTFAFTERPLLRCTWVTAPSRTQRRYCDYPRTFCTRLLQQPPS
jgi:hypothetical protein